MDAPLFEVNDLKVAYRRPGHAPLMAVKGVTFTLQAGETLGNGQQREQHGAGDDGLDDADEEPDDGGISPRAIPGGEPSLLQRRVGRRGSHSEQRLRKVWRRDVILCIASPDLLLRIVFTGSARTPSACLPRESV